MRPLRSARSDRGLTGRCTSASIAVFVTRGSTTISVRDRVGGEALPENRMVVGDVRADQQDDVGALEILVRPGRAVAAERQLVAGDGRGHAQRRVAVVVARAEAELRQLAERVELLGDELSGADDPDRVAAVLLPGCRRTSTPSCRWRRPRTRARGRDRPLQQRITRARVGVNRVVLGETLGTEQAGVHRMIRVAAARRPRGRPSRR